MYQEICITPGNPDIRKKHAENSYHILYEMVYKQRQRRSLLRDYLLTLAVNSRFSHGLVQMVQYGLI